MIAFSFSNNLVILAPTGALEMLNEMDTPFWAQSQEHSTFILPY